MPDDIAIESANRAFEYWGAFGFVVLILGAVIWWLLKHNEKQRQAFTRVIDGKDADILKWSDRAFDEIRANAEAKAEMAKQIFETVSVLERLAKQDRRGS